MGDAKTGIAELDKQLASFTFNDLRYYHFDIEYNITHKPTFALLPCYDEYTVGYSEGRDIVLPIDLDKSIIGNGIFKPIVLLRNEITGTWRKIRKSPFVEIQPFSNNKKKSTVTYKEHIGKFNNFVG